MKVKCYANYPLHNGAITDLKFMQVKIKKLYYKSKLNQN